MSVHTDSTIALPARRPAHRGRATLARRTIRPRTLLSTAIALAAAVILGVIASGGSYALWNTSVASGSAATIASGSAAVTVSTLTLPTTPLYPGSTISGTAAIVNGGTVPLTLQATVTGPATSNQFSKSLTLGFSLASTAAACATSPAVSSTTFATGAASSFGTLPITASASSPQYVCVTVSLASTAAASTQSTTASNFAVTVVGTQG